MTGLEKLDVWHGKQVETGYFPPAGIIMDKVHALLEEKAHKPSEESIEAEEVVYVRKIKEVRSILKEYCGESIPTLKIAKDIVDLLKPHKGA